MFQYNFDPYSLLESLLQCLVVAASKRSNPLNSSVFNQKQSLTQSKAGRTQILFKNSAFHNGNDMIMFRKLYFRIIRSQNNRLEGNRIRNLLIGLCRMSASSTDDHAKCWAIVCLTIFVTCDFVSFVSFVSTILIKSFSWQNVLFDAINHNHRQTFIKPNGSSCSASESLLGRTNFLRIFTEDSVLPSLERHSKLKI